MVRTEAKPPCLDHMGENSVAHRVCKVSGLFAVRWLEAMEIDELVEIEQDLSAYMASQSAPVVYASITDRSVKPPSEVVRKHMVAMAEKLVPDLGGFYVVIESGGFAGSVQRSALAGMLLLTKLRSRIHVVASADDVLGAVGGTRRTFNAEAARSQLIRDGVLGQSE